MAEFTGIDPHEGHNHRRFLEGDDGGEEDESLGASAGTWRWGASIMGGFWIPVMMHSFFPHDHSGTGGHSHGNHVHDNQNDGEGSNQNNDLTLIENGDNNTKALEKQETDATATGIEESEDIIKPEEAVAVVVVTSGDDDDNKDVTDNSSDSNATTDNDDDSDEYVLCCCGLIRLKNLSLFVSMNLGEALHNFTDGIFVGTAWLLCGNSMAISIAIASILHELPNQLAGYLVMVNQCGINPFVALLLNFLFGLSILFGGLLVLVFDFNQVTIGCILAIGGGTFIHVAIGELLQHAERNMTSGVQRIYSFIAFLVGAIPIGLVLINHEHC
jgi:zinc transporter ZupT